MKISRRGEIAVSFACQSLLYSGGVRSDLRECVVVHRIDFRIEMLFLPLRQHDWTSDEEFSL